MTVSIPKLVRDLLLVAAYNIAIGLFLTAVTSYPAKTNLVYANCIGFGIYLGITTSRLRRGQPKPGWLDGFFGIPAGFAAGFVLATWLTGLSLAQVLQQHPQSLLIAGATALLFGIMGTWHFHDKAVAAAAQAEARAERLGRIEQQALATQAELARLQAQIEPHFLFNTLSNVVSLIDSEPAVARNMLLNLTALLRTALRRSRRESVTLAEELDLLRAYLGIMAIRMGPRLEWNVEADAGVLDAQLPPLLVQPLVENAIRHGLEPKPEGGHLRIHCRREGEMVDILVEDDGLGLDASQASLGHGLGLSNIHQRLTATHGTHASLELASRPGGGVCAHLKLPYYYAPANC
ncbi:MAG: sensor histidine kinase [Deltaproteobacteria bacterium]|nr:sensor histidine kinase [Deltaproteobacteria bacterium]